MAWTGIIEYNWENLDGKNPKHEKRWVLPLFVPGSAEFLNMRKSQIDEHPEVAAFFERMTMLPLEKITPMVPPGGEASACTSSLWKRPSRRRTSPLT